MKSFLQSAANPITDHEFYQLAAINEDDLSCKVGCCLACVFRKGGRRDEHAFFGLLEG